MNLFEIIILSSVVITSVVLIYLVYSVHALENESIFLQKVASENSKSITKSIGEDIESSNRMQRILDLLVKSTEADNGLLRIIKRHQNDIDDLNGIIQGLLEGKCTSKTSTES